jgi:hypothetical protein
MMELFLWLIGFSFLVYVIDISMTRRIEKTCSKCSDIYSETGVEGEIYDEDNKNNESNKSNSSNTNNNNSNNTNR